MSSHIGSGKLLPCVAGGVALGALLSAAYFKYASSSSASSKKEKPAQLEVAYWTIRGLGAPARMMVMAAGVPLKATCYDVVPKSAESGGGWDLAHYHAARPGLRAENALANLPYVRDGDVFVTQSNAVFMYLGRRLGMLGDGSERDVAACEMLLCECKDLRDNFTRTAYGKGDERLPCKQLLDGQKTGSSLWKLDSWLRQKPQGQSKLFFVGGELSAPDFHIWEMCDQYSIMAAKHGLVSPLDDLPCLRAFYAHFKALPQNQKYFASPLSKFPLNQKMAKLGGSHIDHGTWVRGTEYDFHPDSGVSGAIY